jgi:hypothetical protein
VPSACTRRSFPPAHAGDAARRVALDAEKLCRTWNRFRDFRPAASFSLIEAAPAA